MKAKRKCNIDRGCKGQIFKIDLVLECREFRGISLGSDDPGETVRISEPSVFQ